MKDKHRLGYKITTDLDLLNDKYAVTPEMAPLMEKYHKMAEEGKDETEKKLIDAIEKYPENPQLKNYLSAYFSVKDNFEKAHEVNRWIVKEHPDYLYGKINLANEYFLQKEYDMMPEILGYEMEIKALYPDRDIFHLKEVTSFLRTAILYFCATDDMEQAEIRYNILEKIDELGDDLEFARKYIMNTRISKAQERFSMEEENLITVEVNKQQKSSKISKPAFKHSEIEQLYKTGLYIEEKTIKQILDLPYDSIRADLEKVLKDSYERYSYHIKKFEENDYDEETRNFVVHSIFLLAELEAHESLDEVFRVLSQSEEYMNRFFGDLLTEVLWEPVFKIVHSNLNATLKFMQRPGIYRHSRTIISTITIQLLLHHPEKRQEVIAWYRELLKTYLHATPEDNIIDSDLIGFMVWDLIEINATELLPEIRECFNKGIVSEGICGTLSEIERDIEDSKYVKEKVDLSGMIDRYRYITENWYSYNAESYDTKQDDFNFGSYPETEYEDDDFYFSPPQMPIIKDPKIGRNDPCPCGSGKKYKKCCWKGD